MLMDTEIGMVVDYETLFNLPCYGLLQQAKENKLVEALNLLTQHHVKHCNLYSNLLNLSEDKVCRVTTIDEFLPLSVQLFKIFELKSISDDEVFKVLLSSGTTGQQVSKIYLDQALARLQSKALIKIMQNFIGTQRMPMLIVDAESTVRDRNAFSARAAGIRGLATFGRDHTYLLDDNMEINFDRLEAFLNKYANQKILMFGFTFMVWEYLYKKLKNTDLFIDLSHATLIHSGGWKKLVEQSVDNKTFKEELKLTTGLNNIHNFYGMVEQVGSIFMECEEGYLHAPLFADIIVRDIMNNQVNPIGIEGVIEVLSILPSSYPGHVLLTEDLGTIHGVDSCQCGRKGKYFSISGRIPKAEVRGCGDTHALKMESY